MGRGLTVFPCVWLVLADQTRADIYVPGDYPTIQAAINAASGGDVIHLAAGRYHEALVITQSVTLAGSGTNNCIVYASTNVPLVSITGPGAVTLSGFEINGGTYLSGFYNGTSFQGITATNVNLVLNQIVVNQIINFMVTETDGTLAATNIALWTRDLLVQCDVGLELDGCIGVINGLSQNGGRIDHTVNINGASNHHSDVTIANATIRTSQGTYGNCIRTYVNSNVRITNCYLYRGTGEAVPPYPGFNHSAISVNGYSNTVTISGNTISNAPWAMYFYGSPGIGGNQIMVQDNLILNSTIGGVVLDGLNYKGIDLGDGALDSHGGNVFSESPKPATYTNDVLFTGSSAPSSANVMALYNTWSNPTNTDSVVYDRLDDPKFGRLITTPLLIKSFAWSPMHQPVLSWAERGAGEDYTVETCTNLSAPSWNPAPGTWPITNAGLADMVWTNSVPATANLFYHLRSNLP